MNIRDAITMALREAANQGSLIETVWRIFAGQVQVPPGTVQWTESRRCFFAGALLTFEAVMLTLDPEKEPTDADVARMRRLTDEFDRFRAELLKGLA